MKTAELTGADLALWVARAAKHEIDPHGGVFDSDHAYLGHIGGSIQPFAPHEDWSQGGPLIDRERITTTIDTFEHNVGMGVRWAAINETWGCVRPFQGRLPAPNRWSYGPTLLIAAMRAFVASVYGDTVPDEATP